MSTYVLGCDDALLPCEAGWWTYAQAAVRYAAERIPMDVGRVITCQEVALAISMAVTVCVQEARDASDDSGTD